MSNTVRLIELLQKTDKCYCGSQVVDGKLKLVQCLFHSAAREIDKLDKRRNAWARCYHTEKKLRTEALRGIEKLQGQRETLTAESRDTFFAGCDFGSKYAGDQYLGTPERQRGFDQWQRDCASTLQEPSEDDWICPKCKRPNPPTNQSCGWLHE